MVGMKYYCRLQKSFNQDKNPTITYLVLRVVLVNLIITLTTSKEKEVNVNSAFTESLIFSITLLSFEE